MVERCRFYSNNMLWFAIVVLLSLLGTDFLREASAQQSVRQRALKESSVGQITSLYLIDADTNRPMQELRNGAEIVASFPPADFNIEARTNGTVGSVQFGYRNNAKYRIENFPPYAFCGNADAYFRCNLLVLGTHTVTATPFVGASATGLAGTPLQVTFTIVEAAVPVPAPRPTQAPVSCTRPKVCRMKRFRWFQYYWIASTHVFFVVVLPNPLSLVLGVGLAVIESRLSHDHRRATGPDRGE